MDLKIDIAELKNVEIAETGTWNGIPIGIKDLDEMIKNFQSGIIEPYLNIDYNDKFTDKVKDALSVISLGFVSQLKRIGNKLVADFQQVPKKIAELIKAGMLKKRSIEFFPKGYSVNGEVFNNVLKAVSFFGGDIPAINSLSNDFDILLKSDKYAVNFSDKTESKKIIFQKTKSGGNVMEITQKEYDELVSFKSTSSTELTTLKADFEALKTGNEDLTVKLKKAEDENKELNTFKEKAEKEKTENIEKEAVSFIDGIIKDGKLMPKFKDDKVADYVAKSADEDKLKNFKDDLDTHNKVIELGELKDENGVLVKKLEDMTNDEINDAIESKMKKTGKTWDEIAPEFGLDV